MFESIKGFWTLYEFTTSGKRPRIVIEQDNDCMGDDLYECAESCEIYPFDSHDFQHLYDVEGDTDAIAIMPKREDDPEFVWEFAKENPHPEIEPYWAMMHRVWN